MATLQKTVGLRWLLLGVFPFGVTLRRVEGSHAVWVRSNVEPVEWSDGNRVISSITPENIAAGQIWVRGTDGVSTGTPLVYSNGVVAAANTAAALPITIGYTFSNSNATNAVSAQTATIEMK